MDIDVQGLFSDHVVVVASTNPELDESLLWPEEARTLGEAVVAGRRWDFVTGRRCARLAIEALGREPLPVLTGDRREPLWPGGVVGAITHTNGFAAAAVANAATLIGVGIDAEPAAPLPEGVVDRIVFGDERRWLKSREATAVEAPDRLIFCIKEAIYKVWFPIAGEWLGFDDAAVVIDPATRTFTAKITKLGPIDSLGGRYNTFGNTLVAAIEYCAPT